VRKYGEIDHGKTAENNNLVSFFKPDQRYPGEVFYLKKPNEKKRRVQDKNDEMPVELGLGVKADHHADFDGKNPTSYYNSQHNLEEEDCSDDSSADEYEGLITPEGSSEDDDDINQREGNIHSPAKENHQEPLIEKLKKGVSQEHRWLMNKYIALANLVTKKEQLMHEE